MRNSHKNGPATVQHDGGQPGGFAGSLPSWYGALLLTLLALIPRCLTLNDFFTVDESFHWVWRVMHFMDALDHGRWARTNLTGHPGVTTLWLGALGRRLAFAAGLLGPEWGRGGVVYLALLRLPIACVNSLAVGAGYLVLRRLMRPETALLAGVLWAGSPFLIAHSRLLHLDALLTSSMTLSLLLLLAVALPREPLSGGHSWGLLVVSARCGGFALLTKAPSLLLLPVVGLFLLLFSQFDGPYPRSRWLRVRWAIVRGVVWGGCAALVFVAGWPAMWAEPAQAIGHIVEEIVANGAQPHESGNFFLGQPVADPGVLFYPVVVLWRSSPPVVVGLCLLPLALRHRSDERWFLLAVLLFVLLFGGAMSLLPKKFDRYLLPVFPSLTFLAAAGLVAGLERFLRSSRVRLARVQHSLSRPSALPSLVAVLLLLINVWYHPFYLSYFNPLVGGGASAPHVLLVGWGEGMEQVGAWLRQRPDLMRSPVMSWGPRTLEPFVPVRVVPIGNSTVKQPASYAVLYTRGVQRNEEAAAFDDIRQAPPLWTLRMYGIDYAAVYQPARPFSEPLDVVFGEGLHLRGFSQSLREDDRIVELALSWNVQSSRDGGLFCFVHVLSRAGERVAQVDVPIDEGLFPTWEVGQQFGGPIPIELPPDLPAGLYRVVLGVYDPVSRQRLPVTQGTVLPEDIDGPWVIPVTTFEVGR